jgi:class 3 adenylate cyclase
LERRDVAETVTRCSTQKILLRGVHDVSPRPRQTIGREQRPLLSHGILGKHAGDGASALFLAEDVGGDSAAARSAIGAAREIRDRATALKDSVRVKVGVHWGATLMVGQVSTRGRLEVTALGDEMNEAARIENAAHGGVVLASKDAIERLSTQDAHSLAVDPDTLTYRTIAELTTNEKAVRDAGSIAVAEL